MQPYFLPYIGYYSLIKNTDQWIVFDPVQFIRHGWIERNRILKPGEGWQYISVPLQKYHRDTLIKDIKIREQEDWRDKIYRQLDHYKKAPFFKQTIEVLQQGLDLETESIVHLNASVLNVTCKYIGIPFRYSIFSEMNLDIEEVNDAGEWALVISKALQASEYINPPGGVDIFDKQKFGDAGIKLSFLSPVLQEYSQRRKVFEPGLSIVDVMMFNSPETINGMLDKFELS